MRENVIFQSGKSHAIPAGMDFADWRYDFTDYLVEPIFLSFSPP